MLVEEWMRRKERLWRYHITAELSIVMTKGDGVGNSAELRW